MNSTLPAIGFASLFYHPLQRRSQVVMLPLQLLQPQGFLWPSQLELGLTRHVRLLQAQHSNQVYRRQPSVRLPCQSC